MPTRRSARPRRPPTASCRIISPRWIPTAAVTGGGPSSWRAARPSPPFDGLKSKELRGSDAAELLFWHYARHASPLVTDRPARALDPRCVARADEAYEANAAVGPA